MAHSFDVNLTVSSQSNIIIIYMSRSQRLILNSSCSAYITILGKPIHANKTAVLNGIHGFRRIL